MKKVFISIGFVFVLFGCATKRFTISEKHFIISDEMAKPIIDAQWSEMVESMTPGSLVCVWWCDDERFVKEPGEQEHVTTIAYWIQGYIEQQLVRGKQFDVVTRTQLNKIFREQEFQYSGHVDDSTMVSIGKIIGAKYMVDPRITPINTLNIQILDVQTGKIMYLSDNPVKTDQKVGA